MSQPSTNQYDIAIVGATPGGLACAIRLARLGRRVALIEASAFLGGTWASGVQVLDTRYGGKRCPILTEFGQRLTEHYRKTAGDGSTAHRLSSFGDPTRHGERPRFEPKVAETIWGEMLRECTNVTLWIRFRLERAEMDGKIIRRLWFGSEPPGDDRLLIVANLFVDATYEADLAAAARAPYTVGREGRSEFGEPHAGEIYTTIEPIGAVGRDLAESLHLHYFNRTSRRGFAASTGTGDRAVQAYATRLVLTNVDGNRRPVPRPDTYDRAAYLGILDRSPGAAARGYPLSSHYLHGDVHELALSPTLPHDKTDWIGANFVGRNHGYPDSAPAARRAAHLAHADHALGMMYFLQNDSAVPATVRSRLGGWGLAKDEYVANGNVPYQMYVREARRLRGEYIFTEHDARLDSRHQRTPIHPDSVGFGEWPMDSHDCNPVRQPESFNDGEFILAEETRPSQIPYRCLISPAVENLLVPVCVSASHVGWGTLRLEPVFVHLGEVAAIAADLCLTENRQPLHLNGCRLQRELLRREIAVTYFSDVELGGSDPLAADLQLLGSRGFFPGYTAGPDNWLTEAQAETWKTIFSFWSTGGFDPNRGAALFTVGGRGNLPMVEDGQSRLRELGWQRSTPLQVREAAQVMAVALRGLADPSLPGRSPATAAST